MPIPEIVSNVVVIGAGIAGLCTAVYARKCGCQVILLEQHGSPGGLATSWRRGDYIFETCLHWLTGVDPKKLLNSRWREGRAAAPPALRAYQSALRLTGISQAIFQSA